MFLDPLGLPLYPPLPSQTRNKFENDNFPLPITLDKIYLVQCSTGKGRAIWCSGVKFRTWLVRFPYVSNSATPPKMVQDGKLPTAHYILLLTAPYTLHTSHCKVQIAYCTVQTENYTCHPLRNTQYTVHYAYFTLRFTHFTLHTAHCTL